MTVVCAVTVLAAPGTAFADPGPTPSPGTLSAAPSPAATPGKDLEAVREKLDKLYRAAASATDEYNAAEEKADKQSAEIVELAKKIVKGQEKLDGLKDRGKGAAARSQYRTGGLPDEAKLLLSDDPEDFLDGTGRVNQGQRATKGLLGEMTRAQEDLKAYAADASAQFKKLEANRKAKATAQKKIEKQIAAAEKLESELEKEGEGAPRPAGAGGPGQGPDRLARLRHPQGPRHRGDRAGQEGRRVRHRPDRKAVPVGRRGPEGLRLLRSDLTGLGGGGDSRYRAPRSSSGSSSSASTSRTCVPAT